MKVDDVIEQMGPWTGAQPNSQNSGETSSEVTKVYHEMYAFGLSAFFESNWFYFAENGKMTFPREGRAADFLASFLKTMASSSSFDLGQIARLEARVVWELSRTAYQVPEIARTAPQAVLPSWTDPLEARHRVQVVECLLSSDSLSRNPLTPPYNDKDTLRVRQFDFWYTLAELLRGRDNHHGPEAVKLREDCLARMRSLLDGRENRDVLYSIAVVREMRPKYGAMSDDSIPQHVNETDPRSRFVVASNFILREATTEDGSTNVVRRFSQIAAIAHVQPGNRAQVAGQSGFDDLREAVGPAGAGL